MFVSIILNTCFTSWLITFIHSSKNLNGLIFQDIKNENGNKAVSVHEDTIVHVIENSSDMKNTATRHNKIKPHGWNKTKCYLFLFFILLFFVWVIVYYAWNQGYISQLIQFTEWHIYQRIFEISNFARVKIRSLSWSTEGIRSNTTSV